MFWIKKYRSLLRKWLITSQENKRKKAPPTKGHNKTPYFYLCGDQETGSKFKKMKGQVLYALWFSLKAGHKHFPDLSEISVRNKILNILLLGKLTCSLG